MPILGPLIGLGGAIAGGLLQQRGAQDALAAGGQFQDQGLFTPHQTVSPFGTTMFNESSGLFNVQLDPRFSNLLQQSLGLSTQASSLLSGDTSSLATERLRLLREQAAPQEEGLLGATRANLLNRGRLGVLGNQAQAVTGAQVNPELAAISEGLARADLQRQLAAQDLAFRERGQALQQFGIGAQQAQAIPTTAANIGLNARSTGRAPGRFDTGAAEFAAAPNALLAQLLSAGLGSFGSAVSQQGLGLSGLFGGGGGGGTGLFGSGVI